MIASAASSIENAYMRGNSGELHSRQAKIGVRENCEMFCSLSVKSIAAEL